MIGDVFRQLSRPPALLLADPTLEAFQALGLVPMRCRGCGCSQHRPCVGTHPELGKITCEWVRPS